MNDNDLPIHLWIPTDQAMAFAQLLKRLCHSDCERLADKRSYYGACKEADVMWDAVQTVQRQLAEAGYAPR